MDWEQAGRLLTLAWFLRTQVPRRQFSTKTIISPGAGLSYKSAVKELSAGNDCGTTACVIGWCAVVFPRDFRANQYGGVELRPSHPDYIGGLYAYFGLSIDEVDEVLYAWKDGSFEKRTPKQQAAVIERVVRRHGWDYDD